MTRSKAEELLNDMLPPFEKYKKAVAANKKLKIKEKERLLDIVVKLEKVEKGRYREEFNLDEALETLAKIQKKQGLVTPFLIKQVLFYLSCRYLKCNRCKTEEEKTQCRLYQQEECCKVTQGALIKKLGDYGVFLSHNFFSRLGLTPESYVLTKEHKNINPPFPYLGQKKNELASAIRHLAYQAGKYSVFVDVFGGSGAACAAIPKKDRVTYYYNEKNRSVENLFSVLADEQLHQELIVELENTVKHMKREHFSYENVDFEKEVQLYKSRRKRPISEKEKRIEEENSLDGDMDIVSLIQFFKKVYKSVETQEENFVFIYEGHEYTKEDLLRISGNAGFFFEETSYKMIEEYAENYMQKEAFRLIEVEAGGKKTDLHNKNRKYIQDWCRKFCHYFENVRKKKGKIKKDEQIKYAVAEFCFWYFSTHGSTGVSPVLKMLEDEEEKKYNSVLKLLKVDFRTKIEAFHQEIRRFQCSQKDFHAIFTEHDSKNTLFYVDAPYLGTQDYKDKENGVEKFDEVTRAKLMQDVLDAQGKVIFSCRAIKNKIENAKKSEDLKTINAQIISQVVMPFVQSMLNGGREWYILALEKGGSLEELIEKNKVAEVMITNFEIFPFRDENYENVCFEVYNMEEFLKMLVYHVKPEALSDKKDR